MFSFLHYSLSILFELLLLLLSLSLSFCKASANALSMRSSLTILVCISFASRLVLLITSALTFSILSDDAPIFL